ncbi:type VII secretion protein EccC [Virgisporangium aliadipatigenens]|uniref:Type VII secretion protein EccC n=1 Tax=Virgisporangium aliadipatigenens TaxID=741659 RepID=A0A8J3YWE4_9ACTN|nr:type VII secretion protein EccC [Virgisporangium aliadipatigenens]
MPEPVGSRWGQLVQFLPMLLGTVATALLFAGRSGDRYSLIVGAIFGLSTLGMLATTWGSGGGQPKKAEMIAARRDYLRQLAVLRRRVRETARRQREALHYRHPEPGQLWCAAESHRIWERRVSDGDFGVVRVGVGPQTLATPLVPPVSSELEDLEPVTALALRRFLDTYSVVPDLPVAVSVRSFARVFVRGGDAARDLTRAMLGQLAVFHSPDDLVIAVCAAPDRRAEWEWTKWLPHAMHPSAVDGAGPVRLVATSAAVLEERLSPLISGRPRYVGTASAATPHVVVVLDGGDPAGAEQLSGERAFDGVTLIDLDRSPPRLLDRTMLVLSAGAGILRTATLDESGEAGRPDAFSRVEAEALARALAPKRPVGTASGADEPLRRDAGLAALLDIRDPAGFDVVRAAAPRPQRQRLRVPIGVGTDGQPVELDLKESAQDGMGPHGLVIGATGSGKSELLRTLVLALATTHASGALNFVLVDFKGGATFAPLGRLPHVAAMITNLAEELYLVDRMTEAINGELVRRQELLRAAGNYASIRDYDAARAAGTPLAPLPTLLIICDEFSELLSAKPDLIDLFVQIGRVGRSLGVHLLLASQRLEEGRLRGLDTHLSYRVGLRTFSALESRAVLGVPDAYELPRSPGHGYLKFGTEPLVRFRAAYASGAYRPPHAAPDALRRSPVLDYSTHDVSLPPAPAPVREQREQGPTLLDVMVGRLAGQGVPAHQVWLPPLVDAPAFDALLGVPAVDAARGLTVADSGLHGALRVPVGMIDKPLEQRHDPMWLALEGAAGHVAVVGSARSGKSTLLRTLVTALALTHTPGEIQVYCLDFGGGALGGLADLPHVGGVAGRQETTSVRRTVAEIVSLLAARERRFAEQRIESMAEYRRRRATAPGDDPYGDVFLVIDGWSTLRTDYDELELTITDLATRGLAYGIHVVAAAMRWNDFRPSIRDQFGTRLELRLGDPSDSEVDRRLARQVPAGPGHGLTVDKHHFLGGVPRLGTGEPADLIKAIADAWPGPRAPRVRLLPEVVPYADIATAALHERPWALPIGIDESDLGPVLLDFATEPHLLLFGDAESGKTSFLRALAATIMARFTPDQARILLIDYRRGLLGGIAGEHLIGYGSAAQQAKDLMDAVAGRLQLRLPGPDVTAEQLRTRSWWDAPEVFLLVDDYDLVSSGGVNPLHSLMDYLPQGRDIGFHLVLTRRTGGAGRALYDPVIQRMRELSGPGLVLSGSRDEGSLIGNVRPEPLPPGRGRLITRREGVRLIQLAFRE